MAYKKIDIVFGGGLNNKDADFDIQDNQASALQNIVFDDPGVIKTRQGYDQSGSTMASTAKSVGAGKYAYSAGTGTITLSRYFVSGTDAYKDSTATAQSLALTSGVSAQLVQASNELYLFNGTDAVRNLSNTTWTTLSSGAPMSGSNTIGRYAVYKGGMFYVAGTNAAPDLVYVSGDADGSLNTPEDFSGGWSYYAGKNDGYGIVTGLIEFHNQIVIVKERAVYTISGNTGDSQSVVRRVTGIGCIAPKSLATDGDFVYFQAADGHIYAFDGVKPWNISDVISGTIEDDINSSELDQSAGVYDSIHNRYLLSVVPTAGSAPTMVLDFDIATSTIQTNDYNLRTWSIWTNIPANVWLEYADTAGTMPSLYFGSSAATGKVYLMYSGTDDDGSAINCYYDTKNYNAGEPHREKQYKYLYTNTRSVGAWEMDVQYAINGSDFAGATPDTLDLTVGGAILPFTLPVVLTDGFLVSEDLVLVPSSGRNIKIRYAINALNHFYEVFSGTLYFRYSKLRLRYSQT